MQKTTARENGIQALKFFLFSCSAGVIEALSFTLLYELAALPYWPAYLVALVLSVVWNFTLNRSYTFKSAANVPMAMLKVFGYYCVFTPVSTLLGDYFEDTLGVNGYLVLFVTMVLNMVTEFLFCKYVVYRNSIGTRVSDKAEKKAASNS